MAYQVGIDAGSKTIKIVILDETGKEIHSAYRRHQANIIETTRDLIHEAVWRHGDLPAQIAITGSAGIELARILELPFVQEVIATTHAVDTMIPQADVVIELGGEDAKIIYLKGGLEQRMNATCAGGTGGFIDTMAFMLGVRSNRMSDLALAAKRTYPIASRCAVFAQTDVRPLLNAGARKEDIAASVLDAVVKQTLGGLACGRPIKGTVVFLGGPLEHIPNLVHRFRTALGLNHQEGIKPNDAHLFTAKGCALMAASLNNDETQRTGSSLQSIEQLLIRKVEEGAGENIDELPRLDPLFTSGEEYEKFKERHQSIKVARKRLFDCRGPLYLGIDSGSTTVKLALIDSEANLVYSDYQPVEGDALKTAKKMLEGMYRTLPREYNGAPYVHIAHTAVTGYGETLLRSAFNADTGIVETMAHLKSAQHVCPEVSFIFDIGGQDMKALWVSGGIIENSVLNEACSSGCGSFIEGTAYSLKHTPYTFSDIALLAPRPIDLGTKCTVFMTSRVRHAQKIGASYGDIAAGLSYSVVKNALFKTIGMNSLDELGERIVVQGGAFMSDAVLRAFELISGKEVIRPDISHLMGAFGAALSAREKAQSEDVSTLITMADLDRLNPKRLTKTCTGCTNCCDLTIISFEDDPTEQPRADSSDLADDSNLLKPSVRFALSGNRCNRAYDVYANELGDIFNIELNPEMQYNTERPPNLYHLEQRLLARYKGRQEGASDSLPRSMIRVGIPHALHTYESLPFWHTLLNTLGFTVVVAQAENDEHRNSAQKASSAYTEGLETVPSESVCYPAKMIHMHIAWLLHEGVDSVFFPQFERGSRCPVSSLYPRALKDSVSEFLSEETPLASPTLRQYRPQKICSNESDRNTLYHALQQICSPNCPFTREDFDSALDVALNEQDRFERTIHQAAAKAIEWLGADNRKGIVLCGRPYHVDERLNHGIDTMLNDLGFAVFSPLSVIKLPGFGEVPPSALGEREWNAARSWKELASFCVSDPRLSMVSLYSFGCSYDATSLSSVKALLEAHGKIHTALKVDEIVDLSHIRIRLRTLAETLEENTLFKFHSDNTNYKTDENKEHISVAPLTLLGITQQDIETGRKYINSEICLVVQAIAGSVINQEEQGFSTYKAEIPYVCKSCLVDALPDLIYHANGTDIAFSFTEEWALPQPSMPLPQSGGSETRIGILGNTLMCFDPYINNNIAKLIETQGFIPVFPDPKNLFEDDVRFIDQIEEFLQSGIVDIVYLQAFGCLKGHIQTRGALRGLQKQFPQLRMTIIDYDADTSTLNQENRILLALAAAKIKESTQKPDSE